MQQVYDAVIVGGGPAGVSCAVWLARLGLSPLLVEAGERLGGLTATNPFADDWIAALPGATGQQIAANLAQSTQAAGVPVSLRSPVAQVRVEENRYVVEPAGPREAGQGKTARGHTLVIASGVQARNLRRDAKGAVVELLSIGFEAAEEAPAGLVTLTFAGGGDMRVQVDCLDVALADVSDPWTTPRTPGHG